MNPGLISIIGNKGNGKSAIAEIIGLLADSHNYEKFAFLNKGKFLKNKLASNFEATLIWENKGESIKKNLSDNPNINNVERCQCIPQQYFEEICTDTEFKRFSDEINNVIFSRLDEMDKENCRGFDELIDMYTKSTEENIGFLINDLTNINREIIDKEEKLLPSYKTKQEALLKDANTQLEAHISIKPKKIDKPELPKEKQDMYDAVLEKIKEMSKENESENQKLFSLNENIRKIQNILEEVDEIQNRFAKSMEHINEELDEFDLSANTIFDLKVNKEAVNAKKAEIEQLIAEVRDRLKNPESGIEIQLSKYIKEKMILLQKKISICKNIMNI